jgi:hypothetical protein
MSHNDDVSCSVNGKANDPADLLWGAAAIARVIGRTPPQTWYLLESGQIKSAKKLGSAGRGGRWVVSRAALLRELGTVS